MTDDRTPTDGSREPDLVDRLLGLLDHGLDVVHDRVLRPILLAGRTIAYLFVLLLVALVLVTVAIIGAIRFLDVYAFGAHQWLSYVLVGVLSIVGGLLVWRRRRPPIRKAPRE